MAGTEHKPRNGEKGFYPDQDAELRAHYLRTTPSQRLAEGIRLSRQMTRIAAAFARSRR